MNTKHVPGTIAAPFGPYSHAVEVPEGSRLLYISGEVGVLPDGTVPDGIDAQAGGEQHVREAVRYRGIEDDREPVRGVRLTVDDREARGGVHPRVQNENPERRYRGAHRHEDRGERARAVRGAAS